MKRYLIALAFLCVPLVGIAQSPVQTTDPEDRLEWFKDAKFGMFIHWGIYTELAGIYGDKTDGGEWMMHSKQIPIREYAALAGHFNPVEFDAEDWVALAREAGQRYMVSDADYKSTWTASGSHEECIEFELPDLQSVQCLAAVEPWQLWENPHQHYRLEAWLDGGWQVLAEGEGDGTGLTLPFPPSKARRFRVKVSNPGTDVSLRQLMLFN